ncbi:MAG TPA: ABC transporter permease, partial [Chitinophagaceae bacterium]
MIKNYLKIAYRNLAKYKFISFINLFGLTVGLTCCLLILTYILHELSYDKFQPNANRVYRVTRTFYNAQDGSVALNLGTVAPPFGPLLQNDFADIEEFTRIYPQGPTPVKFAEKMFNERNAVFADEHFFHFFSTDITEGDAIGGLKEPYSVMLTEDIAKKYFGSEDPLNKLIRIDAATSYVDFKVTGIFKSFPTNTHIHPDILMSFATLNDTTILGRRNLETGWGNNSFFTYIRLPNGYNPARLKAGFPAFLDRHMASQYTMTKPHVATSLDLQKITDIHLRSHTDFEAEENGDIKRVYIFSAIALFILLIACINYMNLSTARSTLRAKEIGIRKTVGARNNEIIAQFLSESVLIAWLAMLIAFGATAALLPWLNRVSGQQLDIHVLLQPAVLSGIVVVPFVVGLLSGIYPAIFMSSFRPVLVLKGFLKTGNAGISFRQVLVTVQFAISIALIICTAIVFGQLGYLQKKSLGFDKDHIVTLPYYTALNERFDAFRNDLLSNPNIRNVARSSRIPSGRLLDE